jgi:hypothetical protein
MHKFLTTYIIIMKYRKKYELILLWYEHVARFHSFTRPSSDPVSRLKRSSYNTNASDVTRDWWILFKVCRHCKGSVLFLPIPNMRHRITNGRHVLAFIR